MTPFHLAEQSRLVGTDSLDPMLTTVAGQGILDEPLWYRPDR